MIDTPDIDDNTKAKFKVELLETLLPQLLELGKGRPMEHNGRISERDRHASKQSHLDLNSALELEKTYINTYTLLPSWPQGAPLRLM